jgi:hypothetical protein
VAANQPARASPMLGDGLDEEPFEKDEFDMDEDRFAMIGF